MPEEDRILTDFGGYCGVTTVGYYPEGMLREIRLHEKNIILTHVGDLIPCYGEDTPRRKYKAAVTFHKNGMIKAVSLETQQEITTPIGEFPAELVTFYDTGELKRVFPLDGKISGFWAEEDERALNMPFRFEFDFASFSAHLIGICFFRGGDIRSITLFPNEIISVSVPGLGNMKVKSGFSLFEGGKLNSLEPAVPVPVKTPIGTITAYDAMEEGLNADSNSLRLDEEGRIAGIITSSDEITVCDQTGAMHVFAPGEIQSPIDPDDKITVPLKIDFDYQKSTVHIRNTDGDGKTFQFCDSFAVHPGTVPCTPQGCANCGLCKHK